MGSDQESEVAKIKELLFLSTYQRVSDKDVNEHHWKSKMASHPVEPIWLDVYEVEQRIGLSKT